MSRDAIMAWGRKHPIPTACAAVGLGCLVAGFFRSGALEEARDAYAAVAREEQSVATELRLADQLSGKRDDQQDALRRLEIRLIRAGRPDENLWYFHRLEKETGAKLLDLRQSPLPFVKGGRKTLYVEVPFTVVVQGGAKPVLDFLARLEKGPQCIRFNTVTITQAGDSPAQWNAALSFDLLGLP